ncbi:ORC-CDC6 family AAA ATPase [Nodularia spumigena]|uniref:RNA polymerase alpha subunit C-terminal domain-containing protein n=1 Tax=Nodularia spumigena UHCC 0060 TaxID=3110300 RepID=A0ABU5UNQ1_NODSP|nr:hypothetical protein [Nodularia spumigena]MEA5525149.1 hypothetical protein [Nodularia spumigena UHCC 0143]MEA5607911.1 hypothetical protein [Nodularia spumigena UHCC 0060]MEA5612793.1 hypothetical protein [Nodularia spumigena UHCC 0040]
MIGGKQMFYFRTESIRNEDIKKIFVSTDLENRIIQALKFQNPTILEGSRGTGKTFLLRMAQIELNENYNIDKILPIYLSLSRTTLIQTNDPNQFTNWMMAKICKELYRQLAYKGLLVENIPITKLLFRNNLTTESLESKFDNITQAYESSYRRQAKNIDDSVISEIPEIEDFLELIEQICNFYDIQRICFLFDEAIHMFRPQQQRDFFSLFRKLRTPYIDCNAAVYPGVTSFGDSFEISHDANLISLERNIKDSDYLHTMQEIVYKQADEEKIKKIEEQKGNFKILAYSASGNPRMLLKTLERCNNLRWETIITVIKDFYITEIWSEHSALGERYTGHTEIVDWGRNFIEEKVIPSTQDKNNRRIRDTKSTCYFWIHRDVPEVVKESLRLLEYTGIVRKNGERIRATGSNIGTRYEIKLGCILALEKSNKISNQIIDYLDNYLFTEYSRNNNAFSNLPNPISVEPDSEIRVIINNLLRKSINDLSLTNWQKEKLIENGFNTINDVLNVSEQELMEQIYRVGEVKARRIQNAAIAEILEYLSG